MKNFKTYEPEGLATNKPNYDKRFGLNQSNSKIKNNLTDCLMRFLFFSRATFFRRCLQKAVMIVILFFANSLIGCASDKPTEPDRLPFGVFPLNDVKWIETNFWATSGGITEEYVVDGDTSIALIYRGYSDTITYFVRQSGEQKAELYRSVVGKMTQSGYDLFTQKPLELEDSTYNNPPELYGWINLEGRKVYFQGIDHNGNPWDERCIFYDFPLNVGDTVDMANIKWQKPIHWPTNAEDVAKFRLSSIDNILVGNEHRKKFNFVHILSDNPIFEGHHFERFNFSAIDGIGNPQGLFYMFERISHPMFEDWGKALMEVYHKDKLIWRRQ